MEIKELVEKVRSEWEEIFIQEEENIRNIFLSNLDVSISMGIGLEVISVEGTGCSNVNLYFVPFFPLNKPLSVIKFCLVKYSKHFSEIKYSSFARLYFAT